MKKGILALFLLGVVFISSTAHAQDRVRAMGMSTIYSNAIDVARDKALESALRNAVEEKVGVMVTSVSEVENYELKMDQILSESKGFISSYSIQSEGRQGNTYKVTIEADVETGRLKDRMAAIQLVMSRKSKPRLMLILNGQEKHHALAEAAMSQFFLSQGFKLVDASANMKTPSRFATLNNDSQAVTSMAHQYGAEIVILTHVEDTARSFKMGEIEVKSHDIHVSGKVLNGDTGEVIATANQAEKGDFKRAVEESSAKTARQIRDAILERWSSDLTNTITIKLLISGLTHKELSAFKERLRQQVKGLKQVHQRSYTRGKTDFDLELRGNTQGLADDLTAIHLNGKQVKILETTPNQISAHMGKGK